MICWVKYFLGFVLASNQTSSQKLFLQYLLFFGFDYLLLQFFFTVDNKGNVHVDSLCMKSEQSTPLYIFKNLFNLPHNSKQSLSTTKLKRKQVIFIQKF